MKSLSTIKPGYSGTAARQLILESSLTHVKYKYQRDNSSVNLVAFNEFAPSAIAKSGGVFTGPIKFLTSSSTPVQLSPADGIVTINLSFGGLFKLSLTESVSSFEVINVAPGLAVMFTLVIAQDTSPFTQTVNWTFSGSTIKWPNGTPVANSLGSSKFDVFSFKTVDAGATWHAMANGLGYLA